ncbi:hypothetical protein [Sphaerisporangium corydalis]|uniref:DUF3592 domain-containing protein n=1 Tax=Sphaerisporangium corydalis TaxID=1441875 RepID=A0ABV9EB14_9ACTN|nr:hypothetical protein [Sphaerisporangium corydalis]
MTVGHARHGHSPVFTAALTLIGAFLLYLVIPNIGPAVRAARADGAPGVFTARSVSCVEHPGHESCSWMGDFRSDAGGADRPVALYGSDRDSLRPGMETRAFDVGRPNLVYGPGGSREWVFTALLLLAGLAILVFPYAGLLMRSPRAPAGP